jgi:hypothetical protein
MRTVDYVSQIKEKTGSGQKVDEFPLVTYNTYLMILRIRGAGSKNPKSFS